MKPSELKKDKATSVRYNEKALKMLIKKGEYSSIQDIVNKTLDRELKIKVENKAK